MQLSAYNNKRQNRAFKKTEKELQEFDKTERAKKQDEMRGEDERLDR